MTSDIVNRRSIIGAATLLVAAAAGCAAEAQAATGQLTIHILDLFSGFPANGVVVDLARREGETLRPVKSVTTAASGRPDAGPLLKGAEFTAGRYQLTFNLSEYFRSVDKSLPANFFRKIVLEFEVTDASQPHHVPLQCTPWTQACSVLPG